MSPFFRLLGIASLGDSSWPWGCAGSRVAEWLVVKRELGNHLLPDVIRGDGVVPVGDASFESGVIGDTEEAIGRTPGPVVGGATTVYASVSIRGDLLTSRTPWGETERLPPSTSIDDDDRARDGGNEKERFD